MPQDTSTGSQVPASEALVPATNFFSVGSELLNEVQRIVGHSRIKAIRFTLGGRQIKELPIKPMTAIATIVIVIGAVILSNLKVEVVKEPAAPGAPAASGGAS